MGRSRRWRFAAAGLAATLGLTAPVGGAQAQEVPGDGVRTVATDLRVPWDLDFLPDGSALVTERDRARVVRVTAAGVVAPVSTVAGVVPGGEGGLLGIALSPDFDEDGAVYLYATTATDNRILRATYDGGRLGTPEVVLAGIPRGRIHNGGRIAFGPDGMLYAATGESGDQPLSQDLDSLGGKILRLTPDGDPAPGNPFGDRIWAYGLRNVQGMAWDDDGRMYATEFGANAWDEINRIEPGGNYGWPEVEGPGGAPRFVEPLVTWRPADASPSGLAYADGSLWAAGLRGRRLWQVPLTGGGTVGTPVASLAGEYGRLRAVAAAPDGTLWVTTSNHDGRGTPNPGDDRILAIGDAGPGSDPDPGPGPGPDSDPGPEPGDCVRASNVDHVDAGRATSRFVLVRAVGSRDFLGFSSSTVSLRETAPGRWERVDAC
jgi:glucose/arabinose dehydrogenase